MQAMTKYLVSLPDYQERLRKAATMSAADRIAQMEKDPQTAAILKLRLFDRSSRTQNGPAGGTRSLGSVNTRATLTPPRTMHSALISFGKKGI
jgi:hypothetical protein